jgi:hypothetical protein
MTGEALAPLHNEDCPAIPPPIPPRRFRMPNRFLM